MRCLFSMTVNVHCIKRQPVGSGQQVWEEIGLLCAFILYKIHVNSDWLLGLFISNAALKVCSLCYYYISKPSSLGPMWNSNSHPSDFGVNI